MMKRTREGIAIPRAWLFGALPGSAIHELATKPVSSMQWRARSFAPLRFCLAIGILAFHSVTISYGSAQSIPAPLLALAHLILPIFFALSGFLVTASLFKCRSVLEFALLRMIRLLPALITVVAVSAIILGPLVSTLRGASYYTNSQFALYFENILSIPKYGLPGVFVATPRSGVVNGSLWTIQVEVFCYAGLIGLSLVGLLRRRPLSLLLIAGTIAAVLVGAALAGRSLLPTWVPAPDLVAAFLGGALFYRVSDLVPRVTLLAVAGLAGAVVLLPYDPTGCLTAFPIAYAAMWLGTIRWPGRLLASDYSYGIYLLGYPIEQTYAQLFPTARIWWGTLLFSLPLAVLFAAVIWHLVEKPILARKYIIIGSVLSYGRRVETPTPDPRGDPVTALR
jgi:peptidoglycan/LPS O-acetylase OafA/YrhL